ncbi:RNA polymerase sigma-70 factor [Streptomyces sp. NBC_00247]|uniref:RNA polymerase sigma-70 factor n=1 Tax=Streptomyces sp. NBC_00247 TaxID=2975689 RepID=UPI002E2E3E81|nr:RNA polymerase sigma-70 factor [Streptomyces sp. NBC_00247]
MARVPIDEVLARFQEHHAALFGIAYRMLGSAADAEDMLQDTWLSWSKVDHARIDSPGAYLARTITNLSLNRLTSATVRREAYVGPWLPEPLVTTPDASDAVEQAEAISLAMLVVLESLSPLERAVFVLKEVFGYPYAEIAAMIDRTEPAVRQAGSRARSHVRARRPRYEAAPEVRRKVTDEFLAACVGGDLNRVLGMLAPDVTVWSDGGGKVQAALRPVRGADKVARWLLGVMSSPLPDTGYHRVDVNGEPGLLVTVAGVTDDVLVLETGPAGIVGIRVVRNPDKLERVPLPDRPFRPRG